MGWAVAMAERNLQSLRILRADKFIQENPGRVDLFDSKSLKRYCQLGFNHLFVEIHVLVCFRL